jgi:hypothetical protein
MTSKIEGLRQNLRLLYAEHVRDGTIPTSARFLYYELVAAKIISKQATGARRSDQDMLDALTDLRNSREIPWDAIVDETRSLADFTGFRSIATGLDECMNAIRIDPWDGAAPLILTESRSLAGVLRALTQEYAVMIAPTNGQTAGFLHNGVAPLLRDGMRVLYLGDYDLAGGDVEDNTRRVLERYRALDWKRLALTPDQVRDHRLTPIIKTDRCFKNGGAHEAVETEALSQRLIVQIVRDRLDALLPEPLERFRAREEEERVYVRALLNRRRR